MTDEMIDDSNVIPAFEDIGDLLLTMLSFSIYKMGSGGFPSGSRKSITIEAGKCTLPKERTVGILDYSGSLWLVIRCHRSPGGWL